MILRTVCFRAFPGLIAASLLTMLYPVALAANYYVSPTGNDNNDGSIERPWGKIITGIVQIKPGDTLFLRGGTYNEGEIWIKSKDWGGTPDNYKTISAYPGETPSLGGPRRVINRADYLRFVGLHFRLPYTFDSHADHVEIINCTFSGAQPRYGAIEFGGSSGLIEGNTITITSSEGSTQDHGIYLHHGPGNIVRANTIKGTTGYGIHVYDESKSGDPPGFIRRYSNVVVEHNKVEGSQQRSGIIVSHGQSTEMQDIVIRHNVLAGNNHHGIVADGVAGIDIYHNTFYNNGRQGLALRSGVTDAAVTDNLFVQLPNNNCKVSCQWYSRAHIEAGSISVVVNNNLYWPEDVRLIGADDADALIADPLLDQQFKPSKGSPVCGAASDNGDLGAYDCTGGSRLAGDVNTDGKVDIFDLVVVAQNFVKGSSFDPRADLNIDGKVDIFDLVTVAQNFGRTA